MAVTGKVTIHTVKPGRMEEAKSQILDNTRSAKEAGFLVARYLMLSKTDPNRLTTVTIINDEERFAEWVRDAMSKATKGDAPWAEIDTDDYEVHDLM